MAPRHARVAVLRAVGRELHKLPSPLLLAPCGLGVRHLPVEADGFQPLDTFGAEHSLLFEFPLHADPVAKRNILLPLRGDAAMAVPLTPGQQLLKTPLPPLLVVPARALPRETNGFEAGPALRLQ